MTKKAPSLESNNIHDLISGGVFAPLNIHNIHQLILYPPSGYINCNDIETNIDPLFLDWVNVRVRVISKPQSGRVQNSIVFRVEDDAKKQATVMAFGYLFRMLKDGDFIYLRCKVTVFNNQLQLSNAQLIPNNYIGRVIPRYKVKKGIDSNDVFESISSCFADVVKETCGYINNELNMTEHELLSKLSSHYQSLQDVLLDIHFPKSIEVGENAIKTLRKVAALEIIKAAKARKSFTYRSEAIIQIDPDVLQKNINKLPFELTEHQQKAINEIAYDLTQASPMDRLLSGDVGYGKSAVIQATSMTVNELGAKVAIMTCNYLLVSQLAKEFSEIYPDSTVLIITGSDKLPEIKGNPIVIGTTAIISKLAKIGWIPDYLIIDEQEKFSRQQRESLCADHTNVLEATATCIPRTGALITHGVMDVSILNQSPVVKDVRTIIVGSHQKKKLFSSIKVKVADGDQVAVVYPIVDKKNEADYKKSVGDMHLAWNKIFPNRVGMLHGRMNDAEKLTTVDRMKSQEFDVLACSSVIERGITLPSLKTLLVVNAERYGLSQLHQLRGRLARLGGQGTLFLLTGDDVSVDTLERLNLLVQYKDGFTLAEMDMNMRGFGDMNDNSETQHGKSISRVFTHIKLMPKDFDGIAC